MRRWGSDYTEVNMFIKWSNIPLTDISVLSEYYANGGFIFGKFDN